MFNITISLLLLAISVIAINAFAPHGSTGVERTSLSQLDAIKRGTRIRIKRTESYWYNEIGTVATADKPGIVRYPIVVRFEKVNYAGTTTNNFNYDEVEEIVEEEEEN